MKQLVFIIIASMVTISACAHDEANSQQDHISVVGNGELEQEPDQATLSISVTARKPGLAAAKKLADDRYQQVLAVIAKAEIAAKNVKATRIVAQPVYEWNNNKRVYKGETVSRSLSIKIDDLDKVSTLMQNLVNNGVSTIDGLTTGFKDLKALERKAMGLAADDAKAKAKFLAERLGRDLGKAYLITEHNQAPQTMMMQERSMMSKSMQSDVAAPPEMFGTQKIQATVNVSFGLL